MEPVFMRVTCLQGRTNELRTLTWPWSEGWPHRQSSPQSRSSGRRWYGLTSSSGSGYGSTSWLSRPCVKIFFFLLVILNQDDQSVITCRCSGLCRPCRWRRSAWPCIRSKGRWWWSSSLGYSTFSFPNNASGTHHHLEDCKLLVLHTLSIKIS